MNMSMTSMKPTVCHLIILTVQDTNEWTSFSLLSIAFNLNVHDGAWQPQIPVGIDTRLRAGGLQLQFNSWQHQEIFLFSKPNQPFFQGVMQALSPEWSGSKAAGDLKVKNTYSYTSIPSLPWHTNNFTFIS